MRTQVLSDVQRMALDAYKGVSKNFSKEDLNDAVRNAIVEACGGEWNMYKFKKNMQDVFAIIAEMMPVVMHASLSEKFGRFADFKDTAMGDENVFTVQDGSIYEVYTSSRGNGDIERQRIVDRNFSVPTQAKSIKLYDELDRFLSGKIDLARMTDVALTAHTNYVGKLISDTIYGSYSAVDTPYKVTGAFDAANLNTLIEHVKAATGAERVQIWGTTTALGNVVGIAGYSDREKEEFNGMGYYGTFNGNDLMALPQAYTAGTQTFAVNNDFIIILPADEKIVKVMFEGIPYVDMKQGMARNDLQTEILYQRRVGAAAITAPEGKYALYKFS